jgi:hypothetical protein
VKLVETSVVIRSRSRGWSLTRWQRDPFDPEMKGSVRLAAASVADE